MKHIVLELLGKKINISIQLDEVIDYNAEYGFEKGDDEFDEKWVCANVMGDIGEASYFGQVQYDHQNKEYSADCDGNVLYDDVKKALLSNFTHEQLYTTGINPSLNSSYEFESDFYCDLMNEHLPKIIKFICDFGKSEIKKA